MMVGDYYVPGGVDVFLRDVGCVHGDDDDVDVDAVVGRGHAGNDLCQAVELVGSRTEHTTNALTRSCKDC